MSTIAIEIEGIIDNYRVMQPSKRLLASADAMRRLFIAERIWKALKRIDMEEERIDGGTE